MPTERNGDLAAYPIQETECKGSLCAQAGLTKLELFAAMAMQGALSGNPTSFAGFTDQEALAKHSLQCAIALLARLEERCSDT